MNDIPRRRSGVRGRPLEKRAGRAIPPDAGSAAATRQPSLLRHCSRARSGPATGCKSSAAFGTLVEPRQPPLGKHYNLWKRGCCRFAAGAAIGNNRFNS